MAQELIQTQEQRLQQTQRLSAQQMLQVKLLGMSLTELEENVKAELNDNPVLETSPADDAMNDQRDGYDDYENDANEESQNEREEREDALDKALADMNPDDEMPAVGRNMGESGAENEQMVFGDTTSFYDKLKEQMGEMQLTPRQCDIMEYLIGSLDDDGLLRKNIDNISDELAIYHNIDASEAEIKDVLHVLQTFDPAGIGAQSLQECLLLQIDRKPKSEMRDMMQHVISNCFDAFIKNHWNKIMRDLNLSEVQVRAVRDEIRRLNPRPGAALGETQGRNMQQITPDFVVETSFDGTVSFYLNRGTIPDLHVSQDYLDMIDAYKSNKEGMKRSEKEALLYAKEKVERAQNYIDAIKQRQHTLYVVMKEIIRWQKKYFQDGDEADLKPMILKDIAEKTGLDISTVSRVSNEKYAQTPWGTFKLRHFFIDRYTTDEGEEMSTRKIKLVLKEIIDSENKRKPLSDEALTTELSKRGMSIARRTVAKYREQIGYPVARLRKETT